jgi:hypothetical protein
MHASSLMTKCGATELEQLVAVESRLASAMRVAAQLAWVVKTSL